MARNTINGSKVAVIEIPSFLGQNTAQSFSEIDLRESRELLNAI